MDINSHKKTPLIITKNKISVLKRDCFTNDMALLSCMKGTRPVKEDIIYVSQPGDFMKGEYPNLTIVNRLNLLANSSHTTAKYSSEALGNIERTSDDIIKLIGQKNYDIVFSALCSVISQELRIQGILALLTVQKSSKSSSCQTGLINPVNVNSEKNSYIDASSQTDETCSDLLQRLKHRKKVRKPQQAPYVVKDLKSSGSIRKLVIKPQHFKVASKLINDQKFVKSYRDQTNHSEIVVIKDNFKKEEISENSDSTANSLQDHELRSSIVSQFANGTPIKDIQKNYKISGSETCFPELKLIVDEDSNISDISCGNISITSCGIPNLLENPNVLLNDIDKHTQESIVYPSTVITMLDGSQVNIRGQPEDKFHIATAEILKHLHPEEQTKVMWYQAYIDWKFCLQRDEDYNLPIHLAVLNNDVDLLRRQCVVLKSRHESVDIMAYGNLTALLMSISQDSASCTAVLLQHGANPLMTDEEHRTSVHLAAEVSTDHLKVIINYCQINPRHILHDNDLWKPELDTKTDEEISKYLLSKICRLYDSQGYSPLMLASKLGHYNNIKVLLDADPSTVNLPMPNCGNTALYVAVTETCLDAESRRNKSKIANNFLKTVEMLVSYGADPSIENSSGSNVNLLLNEFNIPELSMLIANTIVSLKYFDNESPLKKDFSAFMWVKDEGGKVNLREVKTEKSLEKTKDKFKSLPIIENTSNFSPETTTTAVTKILGLKIRPSEIQKLTPKTTDISKIKQMRNIKLVPVRSGCGLKKIVSIDKQSLKVNVIQPNAFITAAPKFVKVTKIDNITNVTNVNLTSTIPSPSSNQTTNKGGSKRTTPESRVIRRDVPIKKQKRNI